VAAELASLSPVLSPGSIAVFFDPPTHHLFRNRLFDRGSNPFAGDNILAPYAAVHDRLKKRGITAHTADFLPEHPDGRRHLVISFGTPDRLVSHSVRKYAALARRPDVVLSAFFAMECPVVEPTMFEALPVLGKYFRRILSWSDTDALRPFTHEPVGVQHFCWPQSFDAVHEHLWHQQDRKFLLMMNANKLPRLSVDELYTARLRAVQFFEQYGEIDLYGRHWGDMPTRVGKTRTPFALRNLAPPLWRLKQRLWPDPMYSAAARASRGPAASKSATVAQYRFALCFENSRLKGWITEKLFDCFFAGTVPVYWGAPDVLDWVPAECFIDMRHFDRFADLRAFLHALEPAAERRYRNAAREYVESTRFIPFRVETFVDIIARALSADTGLAL
jgi:hypothetical protein